MTKSDRRIATLERKLDDAVSALQVILTWAIFEYEYPDGRKLVAGHALVPGHVEQLVRKTLEKIK